MRAKELTHLSTNPDGTCSDVSCPCHEWAKRETSATTSTTTTTDDDQRRSFYVSAPAIRMALADVVDDGEWHSGYWLFTDEDSDLQTERRMRFINAVITRLQQLREHGLTPKIENYCPKHLRLRMERVSAGYCGDCEREDRERSR